jgi:hydrogenase expression/formation protein HypE
MTFELSCPVLGTDHREVQLAHGGGGRMMRQLVERLFLPAFDSPELDRRHDGALLSPGSDRLAFTTDSYVVRPLFFPGGDIGSLAVNGTVNDLAMCGARPLYLSCGFILEEGLEVATLARIVESMRSAAEQAGVRIVTGDTKVVDRGKGDGIFINTAGVGVVEHHLTVGPSSVRPGDAILLSGDVGRHGMTIMSRREGLALESDLASDCAPLVAPVLDLLRSGIEVHCLRDLTRGGLGAGLTEVSETAGYALEVDEAAIPVTEAVATICEILGLDPIHSANEGRFIAFVPASEAARALQIMQSHAVSKSATVLGSVGDGQGPVVLRTRMGTRRILDVPMGDLLPRIC